MIEKYNIKFMNVVSGNTNYKVVDASDYTIGTVIKLHLLTLPSAWACDQALGGVEDFINGDDYNPIMLGDTALTIENDNIAFDDITIPLDDYVAIVSEWKEFLLTPPLNRQNVG